MRHVWILLLIAGCGPAVPAAMGDGSTSDDPPAPVGSSGTTEPDSVGSTSAATIGSSSSGDAETSTSGDGSSTDGGVTFIDGSGGCVVELPDGVLAHCTLECSPTLQDCPDGESCNAWANDGGDVWNASRCTPLSPDAGKRGDPCTVEGSAVSGIDSCGSGLMCWNVDPDSLEGTCAAYCDAKWSCDDPTETCSVFNDGYLSLCLPRCNPLSPECGEGVGCYPGSEGDYACIREGERVHLDDVFHPDCPAGTSMVSTELGCTPYCDLSADLPCGADADCVPYLDEAAPGLEDVGFCEPLGGG